MSGIDLEAALYDWECDRTLDRQHADAPFFDRLLGRRFAAGASVAVLGCGTGRVAIPLARAGWRVTGIDISAGRLAAAEAKCDAGARPDWRLADMRLPFGRQSFAAVILPYSAFLLLRRDADRRACLRAAREAIGDDGLVLLDVSPNFARRTSRRVTATLEGRCAALGAHIRYAEGVRRHAASGVTLLLRRYRIEPDESEAFVVRYVERWRGLTPDQLAALADEAGLTMTDGFADYAGRRLFRNGRIVGDAAKHIYLLSPSRSSARSETAASAIA